QCRGDRVRTSGALLDANVLVPDLVRDALLTCAHAGLYRVHWSQRILDEVVRTLERERMMRPEGIHYLLSEQRRAFPEAPVTGFEPIEPMMTNDEKDRHVLAAAVRARCQSIVTFNVRHFPPAATNLYGVTAKTPDQFLRELFDRQPERVADCLRDMSARRTRRSVRTVHDLLGRLSSPVPGFTEAVLRSTLIADDE